MNASFHSKNSAVGATASSWWLSAFAIIAVARITEILPWAAKLPLAKFAFALAVIAAVIEKSSTNVEPIHRLSMIRTAAALFSLAIFSVIYSVWRSHSLEYFLESLLIVGAAFALAARSAQNWPSVKRVFKSIAFAGVILTIVGLTKFSGGRLEVTSSYDPNDLAYVLTCIAPIAYGLSMGARSWRRVLWLIATALMIFVALLTQSRGALLALVAILTYVWWRPFPQLKTTGSKPYRPMRRLLRRGVLAVIAGVVVWSFLPIEARDRLGSVLSLTQDYNADLSVETGRMAVWRRNFVAGLRRPIGYGTGSFSSVDGLQGGRYKAAHNSLLEVFVELGVLGLFLYARLYFLAWTSVARIETGLSADFRLGSGQYEFALLMHSTRLFLIGTLVAGFFLSQAFSVLLWLVLGVIAGASTRFCGEIGGSRHRRALRTAYSDGSTLGLAARDGGVG